MRIYGKAVLAGMAGILLFGTLVYAKEEPYSLPEEMAVSWYENGVQQGLYTNPGLEDTVGVSFQNETLDNILMMSRDPSLEGWSVERFFTGTVFRDLTVDELEAFYAEGYRDMDEVLTALGY